MQAFENAYCPPNGSEGASYPSMARPLIESGLEVYPDISSQRCLAKSER